jgi:hypothetical protein
VSVNLPIAESPPTDDMAKALHWLALVLTNFAKAEQAIGQLSIRLALPIKNGPLGNVNELRSRLAKSGDRRSRNLEKRIARWQALRPVRHVLAHATLQVLYDEERKPVVVTRHLPLDSDDVTPDRVWTAEERAEIVRLASSDGRSIHDQVRNLLAEPKALARLIQF